VAVGSYYLFKPSEPKVTYGLTKAAYGTVTVSVRATGTLNPGDSFNIATETGGQVESIAVKSGDRVVKGQVLAKLQSSTLWEELQRDQTALLSAQAAVKQAGTEVAAARAARAHLASTASVQERDVADARLARAVAQADKLAADVHAAELQVADARAQVAKLDLRAPRDGVVLKRMVEPGTRARLSQGQGVVTLTSGLSSLNLSLDIPETELGTVHPGQGVEFTVPAFPARSFHATVSSIDLLPNKENADSGAKITYSGTLVADNRDGLLRPGMSATAVIIVARAPNVLVVPNAALTFMPPNDIAAKYPPLKQAAAGAHPSRVWVMQGRTMEPRDLVAGLSDGEITEVKSGTLRAGEAVVTGAVVSVNRDGAD
jgi:HlyD family secretion protein